MIIPGSKYGRVPETRDFGALGSTCPHTSPPPRQPPRAFQILVPRAGALVSLGEWFWKELREGGMLNRYVARERYRLKDQIRTIGRRMQNWRQNHKSDWELEYAVPARLYHRWRQVDPWFWQDKANLRSLRRDNPEVFVKV